MAAILTSLIVLMLTAAASAATVTHGPMLSAVTDTRAVVWLRTSAPAVVQVEYRLPERTRTSFTASVATHAESDYTAQLALDPLSPRTVYEYRVLIDGVPEAPHQFTTSPPDDVAVSVSLAVFTDGFRAKPWPSVLLAAAMNPDLVLTIGDMDHRNATSLTASWTMHRELRGVEKPMGADFHAALIAPLWQRPTYRVWDDHDYCKNDANMKCDSRASVMTAWGDYHAFSADHGYPLGIWQRVRVGALLEVYLLDTRSNRNPEWTERTILGPAQKAWLLERLLTSTATWKLIATPTPINRGVYKSGDAWAGYAAERDEILAFLDAHSIRNVVFVSGDIHSGGCIDNGINSFRPELNVPLANDGFGGTGNGTFSEGCWPRDTPGFGWVSVMADALTLQAHGADGVLRMSYTVPVAP